MFSQFARTLLVALITLALIACSGGSQEAATQEPGASSKAVSITGAGSSFVYPIMSSWSASFAESSGNHVNYQSIGSSGGIAQVKAGTVDFGASDKPMPSDELDKHGLGQFPVVIGGIVPIYNIKGIASGELILDGQTLAAIFMGKVTQWNDPAIASLNPGLSLPAEEIMVVHRSDGSGTTFNFTDYLSKTSADWKSAVGTSTAVNWPLGVGGKGNEGVAAYVRQIDNAIGYVEYAFALRSNISHARLRNAAGNVVEPNTHSFQAAASTVDWASAEDFNVLMTHAPGDDAWPITATTWVIAHKQPRSAEAADVMFKFFRYALGDGSAAASKLDYVPLPASLVEQIEAYWKSEFALTATTPPHET